MSRTKRNSKGRPRNTQWVKTIAIIIALTVATMWASTFLSTAGSLLALVGAWFGTRKMAQFEPSVDPMPTVQQVQRIEALWMLAAVMGLLAVPHGLFGYFAIGGAALTAALLAVVAKVGKRHLMWQPQATKFGRVLDAWGRVPKRIRVPLLALSVAIGGAFSLVTSFGPFVGLLFALAVGRLNWSAAKGDGLRRLRVENLLSGKIVDKQKWTPAHQQHDRAPIISMELNADGVPQRIVIPVPNTLKASALPELGSELIRALRPVAAGGTYAVQWNPEGDSIAVIQWWPPLADVVYYDGRAAEDRKVYLGDGIVNSEMLEDEPDAIVGSVRPVYLDFAEMPHALIVGGTGTGKTITGKSVMLQWILAGNKLCIGDPKRVDYSVFRGKRNVVGFETEASAIAAMADAVAAQLAARFALMEQYGVNLYSLLPENVRPKPLLLAIDEATQAMTLETAAKGNEVLEAANAAALTVRSAVLRITLLGRAAGVHVLLLTQRPDATVISGNLKSNLEGRMLLGASADPIARQMAGFSTSAVRATSGKRGRGIFGQNNNTPIEVQFAYAPEETLDRLIEQLSETPRRVVVYGDEGVSLLDAYAAAPGDAERLEILIAAIAADDFTDDDAVAVGFNSATDAATLIASYEAQQTKIAGQEADLLAIESVTGKGSKPAPKTPAPTTGGPTVNRGAGGSDLQDTRKHTGKRHEPFAPGEAEILLIAMIGLAETKRQIALLEAQVTMAMKRAKLGVGNGVVAAPHLILKGPPGTGKTTIALIIGSILRDRGVLPSGHVIEMTPKDIKAPHVGQSGSMAASACDDAMGGVLFIDEAYNLRAGIDSFVDEARDEVMVRAENDRGRFVVILAGYTDEMEKMLDANPGLRSRFPVHIDFPAYTQPELVQIGVEMVTSKERLLGEGALEALTDVLAAQDLDSRDWGNARSVRVIVEKAMAANDERLAAVNAGGVKLSAAELVTLTPEDILAANPGGPPVGDTTPVATPTGGGIDDWMANVPV